MCYCHNRVTAIIGFSFLCHSKHTIIKKEIVMFLLWSTMIQNKTKDNKNGKWLSAENFVYKTKTRIVNKMSIKIPSTFWLPTHPVTPVTFLEQMSFPTPPHYKPVYTWPIHADYRRYVPQHFKIIHTIFFSEGTSTNQ